MNDELKGWRKHQRLTEMIVERMSKDAQEEFEEKKNEVINEICEDVE